MWNARAKAKPATRAPVAAISAPPFCAIAYTLNSNHVIFTKFSESRFLICGPPGR
jgi:hypothetical protein